TRRNLRLGTGDAVIILDLVDELERAARLALRILGERDRRRAVRRRGKGPLRLPRGRADMRGAIAGDGEMLFVGALGRSFLRFSFLEAAGDNDIQAAPGRAHDQ